MQQRKGYSFFLRSQKWLLSKTYIKNFKYYKKKNGSRQKQRWKKNYICRFVQRLGDFSKAFDPLEPTE